MFGSSAMRASEFRCESASPKYWNWSQGTDASTSIGMGMFDGPASSFMGSGECDEGPETRGSDEDEDACAEGEKVPGKANFGTEGRVMLPKVEALGV